MSASQPNSADLDPMSPSPRPGTPIPPAGLGSTPGSSAETGPAEDVALAMPSAPPADLSAAQMRLPQGERGRGVDSSSIRNLAAGVLKAIGVFVLYLVVQITVVLVGSAVIGVAAAATGDYELSVLGGPHMLIAISQLAIIAVFWPWWRRIRPGSFGERRGGLAVERASVAKTVVALFAVGIASQFLIEIALDGLNLLFPEVLAEYNELIKESGLGTFTFITALSTAILAPINEEIVCRGIMLEYALRAVSPGWDVSARAQGCTVSVRAFWVANAVQALLFGVLHLNIVQGGYAFVLGLLTGWVFWRTGKLRYPMMLHFALNASSYLVEPWAPVIAMLPSAVVLALFAGLFAMGIAIFRRAWPMADAWHPPVSPALPEDGYRGAEGRTPAPLVKDAGEM